MGSTAPAKFNSAAAQLCDLAAARTGSVAVEIVGGARVISFDRPHPGTLENGLLLAQICLGGGGTIATRLPGTGADNRLQVEVSIDEPLWRCMGCQYAGWPIASDSYFAMGSGPFRLLRGKEPVLEEYRLRQTDSIAVGVLESAKRPDVATVLMIADQCHVEPSQLTLCVARTSSLPGMVQVIARSLETALHKLHELGFDLATIRSGTGSAPCPPQGNDDLVALGWTNDAVLYGGDVRLKVDTSDEAIEDILAATPSCASPEFGTPFLKIFQKYEHDFYRIDKSLFSPARISFENLRTGNHWSAGEIRNDILQQSFGTA